MSSEFQRTVDYPIAGDMHNRLISETTEIGPNGIQVDLSSFSFLSSPAIRGYNIKLPFKATAEFGYFELHTDAFEGAMQNMTILFNTLPEERVITGIGSNVKRLIFEQKTSDWEQLVKREMRNVVAAYMPVINLQAIVIREDKTSLGNPNMVTKSTIKEHTFTVGIRFNFKIAPELVSSGNIEVSV